MYFRELYEIKAIKYYKNCLQKLDPSKKGLIFVQKFNKLWGFGTRRVPKSYKFRQILTHEGVKMSKFYNFTKKIAPKGQFFSKIYKNGQFWDRRVSKLAIFDKN